MKVNNMNKIMIRPITQDDLEDIIAIENATFSSPWNYNSFVQELNNRHAHYLVLTLDNKLIGYGGFWKIIDEGHITNIAISQEYRDKGYGSQLIKALIQEAKQLDIDRMTLEVRESNIRAIKAYEKFGFLIEGKRCRYYTNPIEDAMIMWLSL